MRRIQKYDSAYSKLIVFMIIYYRYNDKIIEYTKFVCVKEQEI